MKTNLAQKNKTNLLFEYLIEKKTIREIVWEITKELHNEADKHENRHTYIEDYIFQIDCKFTFCVNATAEVERYYVERTYDHPGTYEHRIVNADLLELTVFDEEKEDYLDLTSCQKEVVFNLINGTL